MGSVALGHKYTDTHLLTHNNWNGMPEYFSDGNGSNETGVRKIINGKPDNSTFKLIQHGWYDVPLAESVIIRQLAKGHSVDRISELMWWLHDSRKIYKKAKTI